MWLVKSLVGDWPSWLKEPIIFLNKMLSIRKVRLLITSRYIAMQSYECVIISKMFLIYFISHGCNGDALVFLGGAEAYASPSFALPMFITIKKIIILHLFTVGGTGTPWHTRGYAPGLEYTIVRPCGQLNAYGGILCSRSSIIARRDWIEFPYASLSRQYSFRITGNRGCDNRVRFSPVALTIMSFFLERMGVTVVPWHSKFFSNLF